jgi:hypothetical protein
VWEDCWEAAVKEGVAAVCWEACPWWEECWIKWAVWRVGCPEWEACSVKWAVWRVGCPEWEACSVKWAVWRVGCLEWEDFWVRGALLGVPVDSSRLVLFRRKQLCSWLSLSPR